MKYEFSEASFLPNDKKVKSKNPNLQKLIDIFDLKLEKKGRMK